MLKMRKKHPLHSRGYSLIEVLVAIVVLSLGLLGFAALQITGLTSNKIAASRSQASVLAYVITDAMRANRANISSYTHTVGTAAPTATDQATKDIANWLSAVSSQLPSGTGGIAVDSVTGITTITVQWSENKSSTPSQFQLNTRL
jgi:type IV pilus assembly protein PilV